MRRVLRIAVPVLWFVTACASHPGKPAPAPSPVDAGEVLRAMRARYAEAATYEDRGALTQVLRPDKDGSTSKSNIVFTTAFDRARSGFQFDYTQTYDRFLPPARGVIWREQPGPARMWWTLEPTTSELELVAAIAALTGVSSGTSWTVPTLLLGVKMDFRPNAHFEVAGKSAIGGVECVELLARETEGETRLSIAASDHSLRRVIEHYHLVPEAKSKEQILAEVPPDTTEEQKKILSEAMQKPRSFVAETTTDYEPTFDRPLEAKRFAFTPPDVPAPPAAKLDICQGREVVATGNDALVDDLEDGDGMIRVADGRHGEWYVAGDPDCRLRPSEVAPEKPGGSDKSAYAMHVGAEGCSSWGFQMGLLLNHHHVACAYDASVYDGVYFWARSGEGELPAAFNVTTRQTLARGYGGDGTCDSAGASGCWDHYLADIRLTPKWTRYSFTWRELKQRGWGKAVPFDLKQIATFVWSTKGQPAFAEMQVDRIGFFKGSPPTTGP